MVGIRCLSVSTWIIDRTIASFGVNTFPGSMTSHSVCIIWYSVAFDPAIKQWLNLSH